ncbi:ABC transporter ATP-binding protein [Belnapia sp. T18]|uniref:ABC transporter ATP-binding protein n=1 Tax=Belnapia arida TaxID=2804533 RepID=A0ABS1UCD2_9PROT|nr:ABC transporter ATP-binding protein [Belnapia arida]MBL6080906.1 ABC transporter ATP-binding protein [Belnapia arida]
MGTLTLDGLSRRYATTTAVERVDLDVAQGEFVALLGPSGCGKTTTLRMVAGFVPPSSGRILIAGRDVTRAPPHGRDTGMVFQSYALFPHMTVGENVAFGLEMRKVARAERDARVREALRLARLEGLAGRLPRQLSGGQQQRVALARALVVNPAVFLLDEPLSNLDAKLRAEVRIEIRALQQRLGLTTLFVTHDQEEALTMADRLVVMERGRVRQIGTAEALYERPADAFVAGFIGRCNLLRGTPEAPGRFRTPGGALLPCLPQQAHHGQVLALRPERIAVATAGDGLAARLVAVTYLGAQTEYHLDLAGTRLLASAPTPAEGDPRRALAPGDAVLAHWDPAEARLLPAEPGDLPDDPT